MRLIIYLLGSLFLISCSSAPKKNLKESIALEEIIYQRTEGLLLLEKILHSSHCENTNMICEKIKLFYAESQPELLGLCTNKELNLTMATYEAINEDVEVLFQDSTTYADYLADKLLTNLHNQKKFYLQILEDRELASLHMYTLDSYLQMMCFVDDIKYMLDETYAVQ
jgi:hypothetical protein